MIWKKKGLIFAANAQHPWMRTHTQMPTVDRLGNRWRVYFGTRDEQNRSVAAYIDVDPEDPQKVIGVAQRPILGLGELGCFDDSGVIPSSIVEHNGRKFLYYVGVNVGTTASYRYSIGLAVSDDGGATFVRMYQGPIMERTKDEPQLCSAPFILKADDGWRMWYTSGLRWEMRLGRVEPIYHVKQCRSTDGINWTRDGSVAVDVRPPDEGGIGRPTVIQRGNKYEMWFSYRGIEDYRTNPKNSYRIGYAHSTDGESWTRDDDSAGIDISGSGWDSLMIEYPHVFEHYGKTLMFYNGNGFGASGFGYAVLEQE